MTGCLSENTIQELVAGSLSGDALVQARQHIETCAECRTLVIELARDGDLESAGSRPSSARSRTSLLWRRAWVRLRGFGALTRDHQTAHGATPPRELLRLEACRVAWMTTDLPLEYFTRYQVLALKTALERAHAELSAAGMSLHATLARRRLGELTGGAEGARAIAEADAWLSAQDVRAPERLARIYMPDVA